MALTAEEIDHVLDLFSGVPDLSTRKMFGGIGVYSDGTIFAVMMRDGRLMLKGQGDMIPRYDALDMERWTYQRPGKSETAMPYWIMPDSALEDGEEASDLAREALQHL
ncbi:TfoX/Sxy family protein [Tateyamaria sp. ANG-S1]|uniref:TfoX/Sxy family protein n=1 Tax=Tateyamaria sp. ANG-S1 TaxID=1577905 RepID=UPI00057CCA9E|nr:TfoX/Sxy family protein [Tateyamaria sp. ANG-S1]KIC49041.1 TfoX-like protein [Tateyamaria sp. ANG-S1]